MEAMRRRHRDRTRLVEALSSSAYAQRSFEKRRILSEREGFSEERRCGSVEPPVRLPRMVGGGIIGGGAAMSAAKAMNAEWSSGASSPLPGDVIGVAIGEPSGP